MTGRPPGEARDPSSLEETLDIRTTPGEAEAIREGLVDAAAGNFEDNQAIKDEFLR
jgi:PHD/YefM family antitoxin component YafN of YafNO toxin-antitoxin module